MRRRSFHCGCLSLGLALAMPSGNAASANSSSPPPIRVRALKIGQVEVPKIFGVSAVDREKTKFLEVPVPEQSPGSAIEIPFGPDMELFQGTVSPEQKPPTPFAKVPAKAPGQKLLLIFFPDASGRLQHMFLDESVKAHASGNIRVLNLSGSRAAFSAGGAALKVLPGGEASSVPVSGAKGKFLFRYQAEREPGSAYSSPAVSLHFKTPDQRLLVILADLPEDSSVGGEGDREAAVPAPTRRCRAVFIFDRAESSDGSGSAANEEPRFGYPFAKPAPGTLSAPNLLRVSNSIPPENFRYPVKL